MFVFELMVRLREDLRGPDDSDRGTSRPHGGHGPASQYSPDGSVDGVFVTISNIL